MTFNNGYATNNSKDVILTKPYFNANNPAGRINLNVDLPLTIANIYTTLILWTDPSSIQCAKKIIAITHYKACMQLYSTLPGHTKFELHPCVFKDASEIPTVMERALSIIGNFETGAGDIVVAHPVVLFKRWFVAGLVDDPEADTTNDIWPESCKDAYKLVWRDAASKELIEELCVEYVRKHRKTFDVNMQSGGKTLAEIAIPTKENIEKWLGTTVPHSHPSSEDMRAVCELYCLSRQSWMNNDYCNNNTKVRTIEKGLELIGCTVSKLTEKMMTDMHKQMCSRVNILGSLQSSLKRLLYVCAYTPKSSGTAAQVVKVYKKSRVEWEIPISDNEASLGALLNPCAEFTYSPRFKSYLTKNADDARIDFFKADIRS